MNVGQSDFLIVPRQENPRYKANFLSFLTFWYTFKIFRKGFKRDLTEDDLTKPLPDHKAKDLGDRATVLWIKECKRAKKRKTKPSLFRVFVGLFGVEYALMALILCALEFGVRIYQPLFVGLLIKYFLQQKGFSAEPKGEPLDVTYVGRLLNYYAPHKDPIEKNEAYLYASGVMITSLIVISVIHPYMLAIQHIGLKMKIASTALMYRKALCLDLTAVKGGTVGLVINLMSNDVNRFDMVPLYLHYVWISPLQFLVILYFIYKEVHQSSYVGCLSIFIILPLQVILGWTVAQFRRKVAVKTDKRVRQMNEIITGIAVIKMYAWEYFFTKLIDKSRKEEIKQLRRTVYIKGATMSFIMFTTRSAVFFTCWFYMMEGHDITAQTVFFITSYYQILRQTMSVYLPQALGYLAEALIAISRIQNFLWSPETSIINPGPMHPDIKTRQEDFIPTGRAIVQIQNVTCKYGDVVCLKNIDLEMQPGQLTVLIGPVASGKSCLMNLVLGELLPISGKINAMGIKSYACQDNWLFEGSVRHNIVFGQTFDRTRYTEVVEVCSLKRDFKLFPYGDNTIVGERGVSLSGGQRARINLARCVYKKADIYLLDDPLSAVDTHVGKAIFDDCITGYLKNKIVILATHQLQYLKNVRQIVVLEEGIIKEKGPYDVLKTKKVGYVAMLAETLMTKTEDRERDAAKVEQTLKKLSAISAAAVKGEPIIRGEMRTTGAVSSKVFTSYLTSGGNWFIVLFVLFMFLLTQFFASASDFFMSEWVMYEEAKKQGKPQQGVRAYFNLDHDKCIILNGCLLICIVVCSLSRAIIFFTHCTRCSVKLHNKMFTSVCNASMSFFYDNASGRILNRFSKDMGAVDEFLPVAMIDTLQLNLNLVGAVGVFGFVHYLLLLPAVVVSLLFVLFRAYYVRTSRSVKRLEGITKSPVFSHFNATMQGLTTIRSHGREQLLSDEFDSFQDLNSSAFYHFMCTSTAFGYWLDWLCILFITFITFSFLWFEYPGVEGAHVGLCITQCIGLTSLFQWGMRQSAEMENQITAVERVLEFTQIEHEAALESTPENKPPANWPSKGGIVYKDLELYYNINEEPVLKKVNLTVNPKEKIGIVGRTGAGKSSLMVGLFRLSPYKGAILIDGVDIGKMGLHDLRSNISIIPQEPFIFSGTLRYNCDPFDEHSDDKIYKTLLEVEISFARLYGVACLGVIISDHGGNLSMGQKQLVCLARAILQDNKILVMDEATANMDPQTDKFIQTTILKKFAHCTVLTIAHRLLTVMHSDRFVPELGEEPYLKMTNVILPKRRTVGNSKDQNGTQS